MSSGKNKSAAAAHPPAAAAAAATAAPEPSPSPALEKPNFQGKYAFVRNEDLDGYLEAIGIGWMSRKLALHGSPQLNITQDGEKFAIKLNSKELNFTVGEEFEDAQDNGHIMKVTSQWDGDKLVLNFEPKVEGKGQPEKHTRELHETELILTLERNDLMARRFFKKLA